MFKSQPVQSTLLIGKKQTNKKPRSLSAVGKKRKQKYVDGEEWNKLVLFAVDMMICIA